MKIKRNFFKSKMKQALCMMLAFAMIVTGGTFGNVRFAKAANEHYLYINRHLLSYIEANAKSGSSWSNLVRSGLVTGTYEGDFYKYTTTEGTFFVSLVKDCPINTADKYWGYSIDSVGKTAETWKNDIKVTDTTAKINYFYGDGQHSWRTKSEATCTAAKVKRCEWCGTETTEGSALGHAWYTSSGATCQHGTISTCSRCGTTSDNGATVGHSYSSSVIQAQTCANNEITRYTCEWCGTSYDSTTKNATGNHNWTVTANATCQHATQYRCTTCGATKTEGGTVGHSYTANATKIQSQSCTANEITRYYCAYGCGNYEDRVTKNATGHNYYVSAQATTDKGTEHKCRNCGSTYYDNDKLKKVTVVYHPGNYYGAKYSPRDGNGIYDYPSQTNTYKMGDTITISDGRIHYYGGDFGEYIKNCNLEHYHFVGWTTDSYYRGSNNNTCYAVGQKISFNESSDKTLNLYPRFEKNPYTIKFNSNGGKGTMSDEKASLDLLIPSADNSYKSCLPTKLSANIFTKENQHFVEWNTKADGSGTSYKNEAEVYSLAGPDESITLYAQWADDKYTINYNANTGTGKMDSETVKCADSVNLAENTFKKTGYTFSGWNTKANGTGVSYEDGQEVKGLALNEQEITLYAQWKANTYSVVFNGNGFTNTDERMLNQTFTYDDEKKALSTNKFERAGYTFLGWNTDKDAKVADFSNKQEVRNLTSENNGKVILYAIWKANPDTPYTVKHMVEDVAGGTYSEKDVENLKGTTDTKVTPRTKEYVGFTAPATQSAVIAGDGSTVVTYNYTRNKYSVDVDCDKGISSITGTGKWYYESEQIIKATVKDGYKFDKWVDDNDVKVSDETTFKYVVTNKKARFYAKTIGNDYTIRFNSNGGNGDMADIAMIYGETENLPDNAYTRTGYVFKGWNTKPNGSGEIYNDTAEVKNMTKKDKGTVTLYAQWVAAKYNIKFNANGGNGEMEDIKDVSYGDTVNLPANKFTAPGNDYVFLGWSEQSSAKTADYTDGGTITNLAEKDGDVTLYAIWTNEKTTDYIVRHWVQNVSGDKNNFNAENYSIKESETFKVAESETFKPMAKEYSGLEVVKNDGTKVSGNNFNYVDIFYARKSYAVVIAKGDDNISSVSGNKTYLYGETVTAEADVKDDYSFYKWVENTETAGLKKRQRISNPMTFTMPAGNVNLVVYSYKTADGKPDDDVFNIDDEKDDNTDNSVSVPTGDGKYITLDTSKNYTLTKDKILSSNSTDTSVAYINSDGKLILGKDGSAYITYTTEKGEFKYYVVVDGDKAYLTIPENADYLNNTLHPTPVPTTESTATPDANETSKPDADDNKSDDDKINNDNNKSDDTGKSDNAASTSEPNKNNGSNTASTPKPTGTTKPASNSSITTSGSAITGAKTGTRFFGGAYKSYTTSNSKIFRINSKDEIVSEKDGYAEGIVTMTNGKLQKYTVVMLNGNVERKTLNPYDTMTTYKNVTYKLNTKKKTAQVYSVNKKKSSIEIQNTVKYKGKTYKVTSWKNGIFKNNKKLKTLKIRTKKVSLPKEALKNCKNLSRIDLKYVSSLKVNKNAFKGCKKKIKVKVWVSKAKSKKINKAAKAKGKKHIKKITKFKKVLKSKKTGLKKFTISYVKTK